MIADQELLVEPRSGRTGEVELSSARPAQSVRGAVGGEVGVVASGAALTHGLLARVQPVIEHELKQNETGRGEGGIL